MEEKERYKLESHNGTFCDFHDTETDEWYTRKDLVTDLLNQQDKDIKKLRQENQQLKQQLAKKDKEIDERMMTFEKRCQEYYKSKEFTIEQLEKVKKFFLEEHRDEEMDTDYIITKDTGEIADYLLEQIKQLKEGK